MATLTFEQIAERVAAHEAAEAARNAPAALACRALDTLRESLDELEPDEWAEVMGELQTLIAEQCDEAWWRAPAPLAAADPRP